MRIDRQSGVLKAEISSFRRKACRALTAAALASAIIITPPLAAQASGFRPSEEVISDPLTGAAIFGFDPVAYFLEDRAIEGSPQISLIHDGKAWHFMSAANRAAFQQSPSQYIPAFGGHDAAAIASGIALAGAPKIFAIVDNRIYLFRESRNRDAFLAARSMLEEATRNWPEVSRALAP